MNSEDVRRELARLSHALYNGDQWDEADRKMILSIAVAAVECVDKLKLMFETGPNQEPTTS